MSEKQTEWMYSGSSKPDPESYLLGRRIDDAIDPTQDTEAAVDWISGKTPEAGDIGARAEMWKTRDAFAKAREDPMFIIEKQKRNAHVDFRNNPLKMQKIKELLASELKKDLKKKKKRKKSRDVEMELEEIAKSSSSRPRSDRKRRSKSRSPDRSTRRRSRSPVKSRHRSRSKSRSRSRSCDRQKDRKPRSLPSPNSKTSSNPSTSSRTLGKSKYPVNRGGSGISKKMSVEELERKRTEMMSNANSRDIERKEKYTKRKETAVAETLQNEEGKAGFLHKFKVDSYSSSGTTVEDRIKSGIFSKQRTKADLNTFLKK